MNNIIRLSSLKSKEWPVTYTMAYNWYKESLYPKLVFKIGHTLFWNKDEWDEMMKGKINNVGK